MNNKNKSNKKEMLLIKEGLSDALYHQSNIPNVLNILKTNQFKLASTAGSPADQVKGKIYFFSMARNLTSSYFKPYEEAVILKLDGRKLKQRYKGTPVDYWGDKARSGLSEEEDRIVTDKPFIDNAKKYIEEVHIRLPSEYENKISVFDQVKLKLDTPEKIEKARGDIIPSILSDVISSRLRKILIECKKNNIPAYLYANPDHFKTLRRDKALTLKDINIGEKDFDSHRFGRYSMNKHRRASKIMHILELYYTPVDNDLSDKTQKFYDKFKYDWRYQYYKEDIVRALEIEIHNNRDAGSEYIYNISKLTKKHGGAESLLQHIFDKWNDKTMKENKILRLTETQLRNIVKRALNENDQHQGNILTLEKVAELLNRNGRIEGLAMAEVRGDIILIDGYSIDFGAKSRNEYQRAEREIDNLSVDGNGWQITVYPYDVDEGYDRWMVKEKEMMSAHISIEIDDNGITHTDFNRLEQEMIRVQTSLNNLAARYNYNPRK